MVRAALALCLLPLPADACRLALVLAMDVSNSVDAEEDILQRGGLAAALIAPEVQAAFFASPDPVALFIYEWSGQYHQTPLAEWTLIKTPADLVAVSAQVAESKRRQRDFPTALGAALAYAATRLADGPSCLFETIDVSGDGENNRGFGPTEAYAGFDFEGVIVNGLVINASELGDDTQLVSYYKAEVLRGPTAFVIEAKGFADFERAMRLKLVREMTSQMIGALPVVPGSRG